MNLFGEDFTAAAFVVCACTGWLTAALYDLFRAARIFGAGKGTVFVLDVLFCTAAVTASFFVALPVSFGSLRFFQLASEGMGAAVYALTLGRLTGPFAAWLGQNTAAAKSRAVRYFMQKKEKKAAKQAEQSSKQKKHPKKITKR